MEFSITDNNLLTKLLSASELRAKVISSNIANLNTPGFKRSVVEFEDLLRDAITGIGSPGEFGASSVEPYVHEDHLTPARPDGNNVTLELEMNALRENRLLYETYASILQGHFNLLDTAVSDGR